MVAPSWVGDVVMATPTMRAIRGLWPAARLLVLCRPNVRPLLEGAPWVDGLLETGGRGVLTTLRRERLDLAVILANSFRTALLARAAGAARRVGYARDGRGALLTDRLLPLGAAGRFEPVPAVDYFLGLARYLGAKRPDPTMALRTRPQEEDAAAAVLRRADAETRAPRVLLVPGAKFGESKLWPPEHFAAVADTLADRVGAVCLLSGAPGERPILAAVRAAAHRPPVDLTSLGTDLATLKAVVRRCHLVVTNDTGPRHLAAAMGVPVVTLFGPTDPAWTEIPFSAERKARRKVHCSPCGLKRCPIDHRCLRWLHPSTVVDAAERLLAAEPDESRGEACGSQ